MLSGPVAETQYGKLQGMAAPLKDHSKYAYAFLNVPFAAPPVGKLRFQPPQPVRPWRGVRDATKYGITLPLFHSVMQHHDSIGKNTV